MRITRHHTPDQIRGFIRAEKDGRIVRRLQAALAARQGQSSDPIGPRVQPCARSVREWVGRYSRDGLPGLKDRSGRGAKAGLPSAGEQKLAARVRAGATAADGACTLRGEDVRRILEQEFGVLRSLQAVYDLLHKLGLEALRPRPQHPDADPAAQADFETKRRRSSPPLASKSPRETPGNKSRSGSRTRPASARRGR